MNKDEALYYFKFTNNGNLIHDLLNKFNNCNWNDKFNKFVENGNSTDDTLLLQYLFGRLKPKKISFKNSIIKGLLIFTITQFIAVLTSADIDVSIDKFLQLPFYILLFYVSLIYLEQFKIIYLLKFFGNVSIIISAIYIYKYLILSEYYHDDGNIVFVLPFFFCRRKMLTNITFSNRT